MEYFSFFKNVLVSLLMVINILVIFPPFLGLMVGRSEQESKVIALKSCMIAGSILAVFAFAGDWLLASLGVSHGALMIAGGLLLFYSAFHMVTGEAETDSSEVKQKSGQVKKDVSVFPLAFPLITGPGALSIIMSNLANVPKDQSILVYQILCLLAIFSVIAFLYVGLFFGRNLFKILGPSAPNIIQRIVGLLLAAMSCEIVVSGIHKCFSLQKESSVEVSSKPLE